MATTKRTTTTKTTTRKSASKRTAQQEEKTVFELIAEQCRSTAVPVETSVGTINVTDRIGFNDMAVLVNTIVDMCTDDQSGEIKWEIVDYITKMVICVSYCGVRAPRGIETGYAAVCGQHGLYAQITPYIDSAQLDNILSSVKSKLNAREALNQSTAVGKLMEMLKNIEELMKMVADASEGYSTEDAIKALNSLADITGSK